MIVAGTGVSFPPPSNAVVDAILALIHHTCATPNHCGPLRRSTGSCISGTLMPLDFEDKGIYASCTFTLLRSI